MWDTAPHPVQTTRRAKLGQCAFQATNGNRCRSNRYRKDKDCLCLEARRVTYTNILGHTVHRMRAHTIMPRLIKSSVIEDSSVR
jgi:hypothetical protein